jgi:prepilin-type processing-associated H-X9-DG protein/prepilin-type N-terminal cleavage/methylation domain-containing protein
MKSSHRHAFSLVELLVVIGIVAVLIGILLPTLRGMREQADATKCQANLRQLGQALLMYAGAHNGSCPPAQWDGRDWDLDVVAGIVEPGFLWWGRIDFAVQQCPGFDGRGWGNNDPFTGYNYNTSYLGKGQGERPTHQPARLVALRSPSRTAVFADAAGVTPLVANKYMRAPPDAQSDPLGDRVDATMRNAGTQAFRHRGRCNVAFADGHVEALSDRFDPTGLLPAGVGYLSADRSMYDLR